MNPEPTDDELLVALREAAAEADPVPADAVAAAKAIFVARRIDAELAELIFDSTRDAEPVLTRGVGERRLTFVLDGTTLDLEIGADAGVVLGQIAAEQPIEIVEIEQGSVSLEATTDEFGRFTVDGVGRRPGGRDPGAPSPGRDDLSLRPLVRSEWALMATNRHE